MSYVPLPTRADGVDSNSAADVNQLQTNITALIDELFYPVGSVYIQWPVAASGTDDTDTTAFPDAEKPATKFGGTWSKIWNTESIFFRTDGALAAVGRASGKQEDKFQGHVYDFQGVNADAYSGGGTSSFVYDVTPHANFITGPTDDGVHGVPRVGNETNPVNRLIRLWRRTA